jgi:hypothetical protein
VGDPDRCSLEGNAEALFALAKRGFKHGTALQNFLQVDVVVGASKHFAQRRPGSIGWVL